MIEGERDTPESKVRWAVVYSMLEVHEEKRPF